MPLNPAVLSHLGEVYKPCQVSPRMLLYKATWYAKRPPFHHTLTTPLWVLTLSLHCLHQPIPPRHKVLRARRKQRASVGQHALWANSVFLGCLAGRDCRSHFQCLALSHLLAGYPWSAPGSYSDASREQWVQLGALPSVPFCFPIFNPLTLPYISFCHFCHLWSLRVFFLSKCLLFISSPSMFFFLVLF